jgi:hypothetical protein
MIEGYQHIAAAHDVLCSSSAEPRQRLERAAGEFWKALVHIDTWPQDLRRRATTISARLFQRGSLEQTLALMSDGDVIQRLEALENLTADLLGSGGQI